ncbi:chaperone modulator CbpM [Paraglaciecola sp. L1A13]|uniref:chaperone modulator CbpM n=1 Tax=Paraglaciecola sp. L1A13 TaxID=2686359 RepID=UPI00131D3FFB|nr:chaperone modulator CbpM [Paraglaciecola sp. L1A13]
MSETILKISVDELCENIEIDHDLVIEVVEYGIAEPIEGQSLAEWKFDPTSVHWLKKAIRLNKQLEIDWIAVAMVIDLLKQREALEYKNQNLQRQLARFWESET